MGAAVLRLSFCQNQPLLTKTYYDSYYPSRFGQLVL